MKLKGVRYMECVGEPTIFSVSYRMSVICTDAAECLSPPKRAKEEDNSNEVGKPVQYCSPKLAHYYPHLFTIPWRGSLFGFQKR